ncbi:uncharacterized protein LOC125235609 [Leguminivora glycinivorella]|uniref:uncharacterized protein LOC125235609 n=1 Tax=Leguminivora glycinivorella TaxID=1035111 RepID=UPI00200DF6B1|nr:uncharacterized protein LOC125235609 [Leguminivora glycinivorella]
MIKMDKVSVLFCSLYVLVLTPYSMAMTADQKDMVNHHLHEISKKCMKDNPITVEDMTAFKSEKMPTGPNVACFLACTYKSSGVMDSNGMLKEETMREMSKSVLHDPEELKHMEGFLRSCSHSQYIHKL